MAFFFVLSDMFIPPVLSQYAWQCRIKVREDDVFLKEEYYASYGK